jgi:hypothetical protein
MKRLALKNRRIMRYIRPDIGENTLASPASSFTTGSCLMADGGWLAG